MYSTAVEQGFLFHYDDALQCHTRIRDAAKKILMLAAETIVGPGHSIPLHLGVREMREVIETCGGEGSRREGVFTPQASPGITLLKVREWHKGQVVPNSAGIPDGGNDGF